MLPLDMQIETIARQAFEGELDIADDACKVLASAFYGHATIETGDEKILLSYDFRELARELAVDLGFIDESVLDVRLDSPMDDLPLVGEIVGKTEVTWENLELIQAIIQDTTRHA